MKKLYFLIGFLFLLPTSCKKGYDYLNTSLTVYIADTDGTDLLDPGAEEPILPFVYRVNEGAKTRQYAGTHVAQIGERYALQINPDLESAKRDVIMYVIEYRNRKADTITAKILRQGGYVSLEDVKANGTPFQRDAVQIVKYE